MLRQFDVAANRTALTYSKSGEGAGAFGNLIAYRMEYDRAVGRLKEAEAEAKWLRYARRYRKRPVNVLSR